MLIFLDLSVLLTTVIFISHYYSFKYLLALYYKKGRFIQDKRWNYVKFLTICGLFIFSLWFFVIQFKIELDFLPKFKEYISFYIYTFCFILLCMVPYILQYFNNVYFDLFEEKFFKKNFLGKFTVFLSFPVFIINSILAYSYFLSLLNFPEKFKKIKNNSSTFNMSMFFIFAAYGESDFFIEDANRIFCFLKLLFFFCVFLMFLFFTLLSFYLFLSPFYVSAGFLITLSISICTIHCSYVSYVIFVEMFYRSIYNKSYWLGE